MNKNLPLFSFYKAPITNSIPNASINIIQVYQAISGQYYKGVTDQYRSILNTPYAATFKANNFDYVTFNGIFSKRRDDALIKPSGYMVLDIDKQPHFLAIREQIVQDKILQPLLAFISPSNKGVKVVVDIDVGLIQNNKIPEACEAINLYLAHNYSHIIEPNEKGYYIDQSGKDLSRACFICHDPNCFINSKY